MVQNHIHLSKTIGGSPENAPNIKWYVRADGWQKIPTIIQTYNRTIQGKLMKHLLRDNNGSVIKLNDFKLNLVIYNYEGRTLAERLSDLEGMLGERVYYVDVLSTIADGASHTADVKTMYMAEYSPPKPIEPSLSKLYTEILLIDDKVT